MNIEITKSQFESLVKTIHAGSAVYGILGDNFPEQYKVPSNEVQALEKYVLEFAAQFGREDIVEQFNGETIINDELSEELQEVMDDYDDDVFWHELEVRLGKRDFAETITATEKKELEKSGWYPERIHDVYQEWGEEFQRHGIKRLRVVE